MILETKLMETALRLANELRVKCCASYTAQSDGVIRFGVFADDWCGTGCTLSEAERSLREKYRDPVTELNKEAAKLGYKLVPVKEGA